MSRSFHIEKLEFDLEIEKRAKRLAKKAKLHKQQALSPSSPKLNLVVDISRSFCDLEKAVSGLEKVMVAQRTLRELATPNVNQ